MRFSPLSLLAQIVFVLAFTACGQIQAGMLYLALGDSDAFGNDESTPSSTMPSYGDQGYVTHFGDFLGSINGGVRPEVVNLAISGELASSFLSGNPPADWPNRAWQWNLNYPNAMTSQNSLMLSTLSAAHAANDSIYVTFNVGTNDFRYLVASATWQAASTAQKQVLFTNLVNQVASTYQTVLTEIQTVAPGAHVLLPSFFDGLLPSNPAYPLNELAAISANQAIQQIAPAFGATYVDFYSIIHGNEPTLVNSTGNNHLNQAGYTAVAAALDAAVVPEPASALMLGFGVIGLTVARRRPRSCKSAGGSSRSSDPQRP